MDGSPAISRTHGRTDGTDYYSPFPTKVGGLKRVNDTFTGIETCKFEFSTIKNHYNDIHNDILDKHQKKAHKGAFLALKEPPGHIQDLSRSTDEQNYVASN